MQIKVYRFPQSEPIREWASPTPLEDLVYDPTLAPYQKAFKLDGQVVAGEELLSTDLTKHSLLELHLTPRGPIFGIAPLVLFGLTAVTGIVSAIFFKPQIRNQGTDNLRDTDNDDRSPVNRYSARQNLSRPQARVPSIYGMHRIYPDLIAPEFWEYTGRAQRISYLMCLGIGEYDILDIRLGDTPQGLLEGVTVNILPPNTPPSFFQLVVRNVDNLQSYQLEFQEYSPYYTPLGDKQIDIFVDVEYPSGLFSFNNQTGEREPATVRIQVQIVNESESFNRTFQYEATTATAQPIVWSFKASQYIGSLPEDTYRVRFLNVYNLQDVLGSDYQVTDTVNLIRVGAAEVLEKTQYPDVTLAEVQIDTSNFAEDQLNKRINFLVNRRLRVWDGNNMRPTPEPTRRLADALVEVATGRFGGNYPDAQLDLPGLYAIQTQLEAIGEGTFDAVIDQRRSVDEELAVIANAGRIQLFRYGNKLFFVRDQVKTFPTALFNGRNKISREDRAFNFINADDPDSVEVTWIDPELDYRPNQVLWPEDSPQLNVERVELTGITNFQAAKRRAIFEYEVLQQRRDIIKMTVSDEGRLLGLLDWIKISDGIQESSGDGECEISGNRLILDRNVDVKPGDSVLLRSPSGDVISTFEITMVVSNSEIEVFPSPTMGALPDQAQVGYLYAIKSIGGQIDVTDWLVTSVKPAQQGWVVETTPYVPSIYDVDSMSF